MTNRRRATGVMTLFVAVSGGCGDEPGGAEPGSGVAIASAVGEAPRLCLDTDITRDAIGLSSTVSPNKLDLKADNPFFVSPRRTPFPRV